MSTNYPSSKVLQCLGNLRTSTFEDRCVRQDRHLLPAWLSWLFQPGACLWQCPGHSMVAAGRWWEATCPRIPRLPLLQGHPTGGADGDRGFCAEAVSKGSSHPPPALDKFGMGLGEEGGKEEQGLWGGKKEVWGLALGALQWEKHPLRQQCKGWFSLRNSERNARNVLS